MASASACTVCNVAGPGRRTVSGGMASASTTHKPLLRWVGVPSMRKREPPWQRTLRIPGSSASTSSRMASVPTLSICTCCSCRPASKPAFKQMTPKGWRVRMHSLIRSR